MKTKLTSLIISSMIPAMMTAQPIIATNEYYHIGDVIQMANASPDVAAGVGGAGLTWDFSGLSAVSGVVTTTVAANTSSEFTTSNVMMTLPNGNVQYLKHSSAETYVVALRDNTKGITLKYNDYILSRRPVTYNTNYVDSFNVAETSTSMHGSGKVFITGDAYGTLKLPTGTFANVLRVRRRSFQSDSIGTSPSAFTNMLSYMWFDTAHAAPLLRIDSTTDVTGTNVSVTYLAAPTAVNDVRLLSGNYQGFIDNNALQLSGDFITGKQYDVVLYNIIGNKVCTRSFTADDKTQRFEIDSKLSPGIYIANISDKNAPGQKAVIKIIKQ